MAEQTPDKVVRVALDASGAPKPDQDPVLVLQNNQRIKWTAPFPFTVDIDGYGDVRYGSDGGAHTCRSGYFADPGRYKYAISANGQTTDPIIEVNPSAAQPHRPADPPRKPPNLPPPDDE